jgi:CBS domain-containing protein
VTPMNRLESPTISRPDLPAAIAAIPLNAVMSREVLVVGPQDPVVEVWQRMHDVATSMAVVCEGTRVVAVISERTLAVWWPAGGPGEMHRRRVRDVTEFGTLTLHPDATVHEAAELITRLKLEGIPVVAGSGELLGLVTPTELVRLLARDDPATVTRRLTGRPAAQS